MANLVSLLGSQWGDEGKGKIVDLLARGAECGRSLSRVGLTQGHTVITPIRARLCSTLIPSGILYRSKLCVLGNGVAIDPGGLIEEIGWARR